MNLATKRRSTVTDMAGMSWRPWRGRFVRLLVLLAFASPAGAQSAHAGSLFVAPFQSYATGSEPYSVAIGDLNGDGKLDLATADFCWSCTVGDPGNSVSVLLGNGDGTFGPRRDFVTGRGPNSVAIGDLNGDGKPDLALANEGSSTVSVLLGYGDGTFGPRHDYGQTGSNPHGVVIHDLNVDGKPDLIMSSGGGISVLLGHGNGTFDESVNLDVRGGGFGVAVGDLNADGLPDVVTANHGGWPDYDGSVSILMGNPYGWYSGRTDYPAGGRENYGVAIGDVNGDGKLDVAAVNLFFGPSVLLGKGDGTFDFANSIGSGWLTTFLTIGDLNQDGRLDLVVASEGEGTVSVHAGKGDGTFEPRSDYGRWRRPHSLAIGDLNGDGWPDLAVVDILSSTVTVMLNAPPPVSIAFDFTPSTLEPTPRGRWVTGYLEPAAPLAAGDIDVSSIRLNGTVPVDPAAPYALGDHDGDGVTDLMVKFDRALVVATLTAGERVPVTVTGMVNGQPFSGTDSIRVRTSKAAVPLPWTAPRAELAVRSAGPATGGRLPVEFALQDESPARLELTDVAGRALTSREVGAMGPGQHSIDLAGGASVPPGVYFVRLTQAGIQVHARIAVMR